MTPEQPQPDRKRLMDRVWLRHGLFLGLAACLAVFLFRVGWSHYISGSARNRQVQGVLKVAKSVEVLVLGNSNADCVDPLLMTPPTVRLNFNAADLFAAGFQVRCLRDKLPRLKTVLMSVSYFSFSWDNSALVDAAGRRPHSDLRRWLYATYPCWSMMPGDYRNYLQGKLWGLLSHDHWESLLGAYLNPFPARGTSRPRPKKSESTPAAKASPPGSSGRVALLKKLAHDRDRDLTQDMHGMLMRNPDIPGLALECVLDMCLYLREQGVRTVFFTPPFYKEFNRIFDHGKQDMMRRSMARVTAVTGARYYDFSRDPAYSGDPSLFKNSDHLNEEGTRRFSLMLNRLLFGQAARTVRPSGNTR